MDNIIRNRLCSWDFIIMKMKKIPNNTPIYIRTENDKPKCIGIIRDKKIEKVVANSETKAK